MNGHSDVIMGSVAVNDAKLFDQLVFIQYGMYVII